MSRLRTGLVLALVICAILFLAGGLVVWVGARLASVSVPTAEERKQKHSAQAAHWPEHKARFAAVHEVVAGVDLAATENQMCDPAVLDAAITDPELARTLRLKGLPHMELGFLSRFASDEPAAFTGAKPAFYWLTEEALFDRFDRLTVDATQPQGNGWLRVSNEAWHRRFMLVFEIDDRVANTPPTVHDGSKFTGGALQLGAFLVDLQTTTILCQGNFEAHSSEHISWHDGDGAMAEALRDDFANQLGAALVPMVGHERWIRLEWW